MLTRKRDPEDAKDNQASKDIQQPKKLRKEVAEKSSDDQETLDDPIVPTLCQRTSACNCPESIVASRRFGSFNQRNFFSKLLPYELLVEIAKRLKLLDDFTCFRSVSRSLHLCVEEGHFEGLRFRKSLPYLMLPPVSSSSRDDNADIRRQFYSLVEGESIVTSSDGFKTSSQFCFESLGWLLTIELDGSMSLLDPFSDTEIPLPHLHTFPRLERLTYDKRFLIRKMVLSSRPNETSDFILMVIIGDRNYLAFWRLGDEAWNKIVCWRSRFNDVVYVGDERFYAIDCSATVLAIKIVAGRAVCQYILKTTYGHIPSLVASNSEGQYIVKTAYGSLLGIRRKRDEKSYLTSKFLVFDIDIATGTCKKMYCLGRMAVFLGRNSSFAVDAVSNGGGVIKANHIYFTDDLWEFQHGHFKQTADWMYFRRRYPDAKFGGVDSGVFNFETGDIEPIYPVEPLSSNVCPAMWITPNYVSNN